MQPVLTTYKMVTKVTLDKKPVTILNLSDRRQNFVFKVLEKIGYKEDNDFTIEGNNVTVLNHERVLQKGSYETKAELFLDLYWKVNRVVSVELANSEQRIINNLSVKLLDKDAVEVVELELDF